MPVSTSWPNGHGSHEMRAKYMQPDVRLMANAAEFAGVDLRVVVLLRDASETLVADCVHRRDLEQCSRQAETLVHNARGLAQQLESLDPAFFYGGCVRYGNLSNISEGLLGALAGTRAGVRVAVESAVKSAWLDFDKRRWAIRAKFNETQAHAADVVDLQGIARYAPPLARALMRIERLCARASRHVSAVATASRVPQSVFAPGPGGGGA